MTSIVCVTDPHWHGVRRALSSFSPVYASPKAARRIIENERPAVVVFGCYRPEWADALQAAHDFGARTVLTWWAGYVLNEFDKCNRDWMAESIRLVRAGRFHYVGLPHAGMAASWSRTLGISADIIDIVYPFVNTDLIWRLTPTKLDSGFHVGVFGSAQPWKNTDTQIMGAALVDRAVIHTSVRPSVADLWPVPVVAHTEPMDDTAYYSLIGSMRINLCVSLSETFSYLVAESLLLKTPVLTSAITPVLFGVPKVLSMCRTPYFDDPLDIATRIERINGRYEEIAQAGYDHMLAVNTKHRTMTARVVRKWLAS